MNIQNEIMDILSSTNGADYLQSIIIDSIINLHKTGRICKDHAIYNGRFFSSETLIQNIIESNN